MRYAAVTPVRDDAERLESLAASIAAQTIAPTAWIIVENGSADGTLDVATNLASRHPWITVVTLPVATGVARGGPIVKAFHKGMEAVGDNAEIVMKLDADVTLPPDHFATLIEAFSENPRLGITSGRCIEGGHVQPIAPGHVWGAARAYRSECLRDVFPLEERMGWDGIDEFKAQTRGWITGVQPAATFTHHRREGERDGSRWRAWEAQGDVAWFMRYRPLYAIARTIYRTTQEPAAIAIVVGYLRAALRGEPRLTDDEVVARIRSEQRLRDLRRRLSEGMGRE